jgi:hypothetical protein
MTPRERAIVAVDTYYGNTRNRRVDDSELVNEIEQTIIADRQALQSEIVNQIKADFPEISDFYSQGLSSALRIVQSVFAQSDQPKIQGKDLFGSEHIVSVSGSFCGQKMILESESDRRVLAEREACAKLAESFSDSEWLAMKIRARSSQTEEKPKYFRREPHEFQPGISDLVSADWCFLCGEKKDHSLHCSTCVREAKEEAEKDAKKEKPLTVADIPIPDCWNTARIATLHEWQAKDALTIQQLNESNQKLSEKIAQLEKEKNELTQKLENLGCAGINFNSAAVDCLHCERLRAANRKA